MILPYALGPSSPPRLALFIGGLGLGLADLGTVLIVSTALYLVTAPAMLALPRTENQR